MFPRGFEGRDAPYMAFVGVLMVDRFYRNPVLLAFADVLAASKSPDHHGGDDSRRLVSERDNREMRKASTYEAAPLREPLLGPSQQLEDEVAIQQVIQEMPRSETTGSGDIQAEQPRAMAAELTQIRRRVGASSGHGCSRAVRRWQLFMTLVRNPALKSERVRSGPASLESDA
jgi:hypothetical protein